MTHDNLTITIPTKHDFDTDVKKLMYQKRMINKYETRKNNCNIIFGIIAIIFFFYVQYLLDLCIDINVPGNELAKFVTIIMTIIGSSTAIYFTYQLTMRSINEKYNSKIEHHKINYNNIYSKTDEDIKKYVDSLECEDDDNDKEN